MSKSPLPDYRRPLHEVLLPRLAEPRRFLQVLTGPRQAGKTTLAQQAIASFGPALFASADKPLEAGLPWLAAQWEAARLSARDAGPSGFLLVLDEVQKVPGWSGLVKALWDEDTAAGTPLKVLILGSAPLLLQKGLSDSLAGRFEVLRVPHWSFTEMRSAFGLGLEEYILFGGYPGAAPLRSDPARWANYILDSLVETTLSKDILLLQPIRKPALLRQLFGLAVAYSGQILSYTKMLGQLHDAGNTTTLAHYLRLLAEVGLVAGLSRHSPRVVRQRASSPKLLTLNTALMTAGSGLSPSQARQDHEHWGRLVETAVGAHLVNSAAGTGHTIAYWRQAGQEVDFVVSKAKATTAIEVKTGRQRPVRGGMAAFASSHPGSRGLVVGTGGIPLEEFLSHPASHWG